MLNKLRDEQFIKKILLIFLILQPFLDCYLLYTKEVMGIFHFAPTTIIRFLTVGILFLLVFFNKNNKKTRKYILIYGGIVLLYSILHHLAVCDYNVDAFPVFTYSIITEVFYILRMLLPIIIIYMVYHLKFTKEEFINTFLWVTFFAASIIVVMNLLNISLTSYGGNHKIQGNIISWFLPNRPDSMLLASKGWFNSANQISGLFILLLPITIYATLEKFNFKRAITLSLCILAMLMLGTRVSTIGWIPVFVVLLVCYLFFAFVLKQIKFSKKCFFGTLIVGLIGGFLFLYSPLVNVAGSSGEDKLTEQLEKEEIEIDDVDLADYLQYLGIREVYYEDLYPYKDHKAFWKYVATDVPYYKRGGNRNIQSLIGADIHNEFKTAITPILGLGYSRFENSKIYLEKDFAIQYYTMGIVGVILLIIPYLIILFYKLYQMLFVDRKLFNFYNIMLVSALVLPLAVAVLSGHILDEHIVSLYMGTIAGYMLYSIIPEKKKETKKATSTKAKKN